MNITEEIIDVVSSDTGQVVAVSVSQPGDGSWHPTVAVFHDAPGFRESIHEFNRRLAGEGYRVVMPDLYHRHGCMLGWEASEVTPEIRSQIVASMLGR